MSRLQRSGISLSILSKKGARYPNKRMPRPRVVFQGSTIISSRGGFLSAKAVSAEGQFLRKHAERLKLVVQPVQLTQENALVVALLFLKIADFGDPAVSVGCRDGLTRKIPGSK